MTEHLEECADKIRNQTGSNANALILGIASWAKFRTNTEVKPELWDTLQINDKTFKIKSSPKLVASNIYDISVN